MQSKSEVARLLAEQHYEIEPGLQGIFCLMRTDGAEESPNEPIKLLEVNANTIPAGILPLHFGPSPSQGITYASIIVEVTPDEFEQVRIGALKLPNNWEIGSEIHKPTPLAEVG